MIQNKPDGIQIVSVALLDALTEKALLAPRRRTNHNFHRDYGENPNRFLNVMAAGTYVTPHRHIDPPKSETFLLIRGSVDFLTFDDTGNLTSITRLGSDGEYGIDVAPGIWHSLVVITDIAICFEIKPGPYTAASDKDFAPWAPREGDPGCLAYVEKLAQEIRASKH
jgi:cupin fold WbuC family metalloprotein